MSVLARKSAAGCSLPRSKIHEVLSQSGKWKVIAFQIVKQKSPEWGIFLCYTTISSAASGNS